MGLRRVGIGLAVLGQVMWIYHELLTKGYESMLFLAGLMCLINGIVLVIASIKD